ncbi:MAG TPA: hypothetical protein VHT34_11325 [Clostridia bacterium]|nr:hypothetical protein [Clostridia bacterium]
MNHNAMKTLEYNKIIEILKEFTLTEKAKDLFNELKPSSNIRTIEGWMQETTESRAMLDKNQSVPISSLDNIQDVTDKLGKEIILNPNELNSCKSLLENVKRLKKYMSSMNSIAPVVTSYALSMYELDDLYDEIDKAIYNGRVDDRATPELARIRKKIAIADERIKQKLNSIITSPAYAGMLQDAMISTRNGRYVIPIKREFRKNFSGNMLDMSSTGSTVFMEPAAVSRLQEELNQLIIEEDKEVYRILSYLTGSVEKYSRELSINIEAIIHYDFIFAKAKYSRSLDCRPVQLNVDSSVIINDGRHPLLGKSAVPLNFYIGDDYKALLITGPNTGGKTVALKTVGLMTLMVQSGLHVPAEEGSQFAVFDDVLADIGDGQSIEQSLSTFSSHVRNISTIIECADKNTLVIMDEIGAGTDPGEGMGFAVAVLEEVFSKGATIVATTHYSEIKDFAEKTPGFKNGCMGFDIKTLKPMYKLSIGVSGESNAFLIALKLGVSSRIIERAHYITYGENKEYKPEEFNEIIQVIDNNTVETHVEIKAAQAKNNKMAERKERETKHTSKGFKEGDCVMISSMNRTGIVCEPENDKGEVVVMVMKKKLRVNSKRLSLYIDSKELYPDGYDYDIVFESKENRKKRHTMDRKHVDGLTIETR